MSNELPLFEQTTTFHVASRLRQIRKSQGLSLGDIETMTHGRIKAVVLGSYERSDRALSVRRAIELANIYRVPLSYLLCAPVNPPVLGADGFRIVIDLRHVHQSNDGQPKVKVLKNYLAWIIGQRSDWNGEVLSLRRTDMSNLALLTFTNENDVGSWLLEERFLIKGPNRP